MKNEMLSIVFDSSLIYLLSFTLSLAVATVVSSCSSTPCFSVIVTNTGALVVLLKQTKYLPVCPAQALTLSWSSAQYRLPSPVSSCTVITMPFERTQIETGSPLCKYSPKHFWPSAGRSTWNSSAKAVAASHAISISTVDPHSRILMIALRLLRRLASLKDQVEQSLAQLKLANGTPLDLKTVKSLRVDEAAKSAQIELDLTPEFREVKGLIQQQLTFLQRLEVKLAPKEKEQAPKEKQSRGNLQRVKKVIAVYCCKGGVGKSTVAVNLAFALQELGNQVGVFDADLFGPSLPTLLHKEGEQAYAKQKGSREIVPIQHLGIKAMSFGFVANKKAVLRGPIVSSIVSQLLLSTVWGQLDYLIVDMPPGTGDIQLTLCQQASFDGAVIVTTPQRLAFVDTEKGIEMFQDLKVPVLSVLENMAFHDCPKCTHREMLFGPGHSALLTQQYGIAGARQLPLLRVISQLSDKGTPAVLALPSSHVVPTTFREVATHMIKELQKPKEQVKIAFLSQQGILVVTKGSLEKRIRVVELRRSCQCAECVGELTGQQLLDKSKVDPGVFPVKMRSKGNYAVGIQWSDGHRSSIFPFQRLLSGALPCAQ